MNKDQKITEYFQKVKDIRLSEPSRGRIENNLLAYARFHGVRIDEDSRFMKQVPQRTLLFNLLRNKTMIAALIAIVLVVGGGASYAAEGAVPGDALYVVKTEINENIKSAFAISNGAEAKLQARLAEERLEEAEALAARGALTAAVSADISSRVKAHVAEAEEQNIKTEAEGDYESSATVRANLEGNFRAYADILAELNSAVSGNNGASLVADIRTYAEASSAAQANATAAIDASIDVAATAETTITRADNFISEVTSNLERVKSEISAAAYARAETKLATAVEAQTEAKASFRAEAYHTAYATAQTAIRIASEVHAMIASALRIQVDTPLEAKIDADLLDVHVDTDSNTRTEADMSTRSKTGSDSKAHDGPDNSSSINVKVDTATDTKVDTNVIDTGVETNASVRSGISF